jgi:DDE superfamily endonuclease
MLGACDPAPHGSSPWAEDPRHLLVPTGLAKRSTDFVALLDQLGAGYRTAERARPLVAGLDNGPIHRGKPTTRALAERTWLTLEWLPKYAPEPIDPGSSPGQAIERCRRDLKRHQLANHTFADPDALARAIHDALAPLNHKR